MPQVIQRERRARNKAKARAKAAAARATAARRPCPSVAPQTDAEAMPLLAAPAPRAGPAAPL
eukprot:12936104-Alexandrium_andersonii.AAC.1